METGKARRHGRHKRAWLAKRRELLETIRDICQGYPALDIYLVNEAGDARTARFAISARLGALRSGEDGLPPILGGMASQGDLLDRMDSLGTDLARFEAMARGRQEEAMIDAIALPANPQPLLAGRPRGPATADGVSLPAIWTRYRRVEPS